MPLRTSALRSLGAFVNVFAAESFMNELALAAGRDPVEYRLACLSDPRARAVIESAAARSGWDSWSPGDSAGHGIGFARYKNTSAYCAVVAEVEAVDVQLLPGNGNPALGVGETAQGPTVAAIGNAVYDALGVRVRALRFTGENILAAIPD
jgi:CO/xanthine dehydrogenase Mo-binding subunit